MPVAKSWTKRLAKAMCMVQRINVEMERVAVCGKALDIEEV